MQERSESEFTVLRRSDPESRAGSSTRPGQTTIAVEDMNPFTVRTMKASTKRSSG